MPGSWCTSPEWFGLDKNKLYATIFKGEQGIARDDGSLRALARDAGKRRRPAKSAFTRWAMKDNFWQMGDTGPCGPCSELHYDMGVAASDAGHTDASSAASAGATSKSGTWSSCSSTASPMARCVRCPSPSIDTGAGLERVTAVMQGVISNYDTDLFTPLIKRAAELTGVKVEQEKKKEDVEQSHKQAASLRVIADHARASTFLISDGVLPVERRPRLRAAQDHPPRDSPWTIAGTGEAVSVRDGVRRARPDEGCVSGAGRER